jgi:CheY-like chemotaxis protein
VEREEDRDGQIALRFRVTDTGIGLSQEARKHLFRPFTQADESTTRRFGGTGLGLAISRELVHMMQGDIGVESEPGCGATFWFTAAFPASDQPSKASPASSPKMPRVLIVEDSTTTRQMIALQLTAWRVPNDTTDTATSALQVLREASKAGAPFDVVISDLHMPHMDGMALARFVRSRPDLGAPRFVLVTSAASSFDAATLTQLGVTMALRKPLKPQRLHDAVFGAAPQRALRIVQPPMGPTATSAKRRVLVADDNIVNQKVALRQLHKLGIAAEAVGNGMEALEALERIAYDLVLMDCQMPDMDGYEATREIRQRQTGGRRIPVIALTASVSDDDRQRCVAAGMDDFVSKPVRESDLADVLKRWLRE